MADGDDTKTDPQTVPVSEVQKERKRARDAEAERDKLQKQLDDAADKDKTEVERLTKRNTELESENGTLKTKAEQQHKRGLLSEAARKAGFHDPTAAAALLDAETFNGIDSEAAADAAVVSLSKSKTWLVKPKDPGPEGIEKILGNGKPVEGDAKNKDVWTDQELNSWTAQQHADARDRDSEKYVRSMKAAAQT